MKRDSSHIELQGRPNPSDKEGTFSGHERKENTEFSQRDNTNETYFRRWEDEKFGEDYQLYWTINTFSKGIVTGDVLDIGCGSRVYYDVADVTSWVGMDLSEKLLSKLSFLGGLEPPRIETIAQSCDRIPYDTESFDTVCAIFMIHSFENYYCNCSNLEQLKPYTTDSFVSRAIWINIALGSSA